MSKNRTKYRSFSTAWLKSKSNVPDEIDITESGNDILCSNITIGKVRSALGIATSLLSQLSVNAIVNVWSQFGPTIRSFNDTGSWDSELVNSNPINNYKLGDFAGYDHISDYIPGWNTPPVTSIWCNVGNTFDLSGDIKLGMFDYAVGLNPGLLFVLRDADDVIKAWQLTNLNNYGVSAALSLTSPVVSTEKSGANAWHVGAYITNDNTIINPDNILPSIQCIIPNTTMQHLTIYIKDATEWHYEGDGQTIPSPWTQNGAAGVNLTTGNFNLGSISGSVSYTNVKIQAKLYDWTYSLIGTAILYNDAYTAYDDIYSGDVYLGLNPIAAYGYHIIISFEYTT